jgi:hypothetical protein
MLIILAQNVTGEGQLTHPDGTADYKIQVRVNDRVISEFDIKGHVRSDGWQALAKLISEHREK